MALDFSIGLAKHCHLIFCSFIPEINWVGFTLKTLHELLNYYHLQLHNSPVDCARNLFKHSKDAASLSDYTEKIGKFFISGFL